MSVSMEYGGYPLSPVPMITIGKTFQKTNASIAIGTVFQVKLNGNIVHNSGSGGLVNTFNDITAIRSAFDRDGKYFRITCDGTTLWEGYPRIIEQITFNESSDQWLFTCPYDLTLEFDHEPVNINIAGSGENTNLMPPFISNYDDNWSFEFDDSISKYTLSTASGVDSNAIVIRATHDVNAVGKSHWIGPGATGTLEKPAWMWAKDFVSTKVNIDPVNRLSSGLLNVNGGDFSTYNHFRVQRMSETEGSFGINETYLLSSSISGVMEDFTCDIRTSQQDPFTTVSVNGSVQGLEERTYGTNSGDFSISTTKFANASGYFANIKGSRMIYPRAQALVAAEGITLNSEEISNVIGKSPSKGLITYSYEYNNRPSNCITGARTESINISDENPADVFARISIMGRSQGPILQSFNTVTEFRRTVSFDVLMNVSNGCSISALTGGNNPNAQVVSLLCAFENDLRSRYDRVYKERDSNVWEPKFGRYNRVVTWVAVDCDSAPQTSLCSGA